MTDPRWTNVDHFIERLLVGEDDAQRSTLETSREAGLPTIQVSAALGKLLHLLVASVRARRVLEIGTLGGYSAIWLARALPADGSLITLELDPHHAAIARTNLARAGVGERVEIRVGPATDSLAALVSEGVAPFDFVFIDADKESYPDYLSWSLRLSRAGTMIVADNVVRDGKVAGSDADDSRVVGVRRFLEAMAADGRIDATVIQTVGVKGYDGFAIGLVNETATRPPA